MLDLIHQSLVGQFDASFLLLKQCAERCPEEQWDKPVLKLRFCQVVFHAIFFTDFYLEPSEGSMQSQQFHRDHPELFQDYEELEPREQKNLYELAGTVDYLEFCRSKARQVIPSET